MEIAQTDSVPSGFTPFSLIERKSDDDEDSFLSGGIEGKKRALSLRNHNGPLSKSIFHLISKFP